MRRVAFASAVFAVAVVARGADDGDTVALLARHLPEVKFNANDFADVIDFLRDVTGAELWVRSGPLTAVGIKPDTSVTYSVKDKKLSAVLTGVLDAAGGHGKAVYGQVNEVIVLTTPADLKQLQVTVARHRAAKEPAAIAERRQPKVDFTANALSDVVDFLQDAGGVKIHPDWEALDAAGVAKDAPVTVRLHNVPMADALTVVLASVGDGKHPLDYRVETDGSVTISTTVALARR